MCMDICCDTTLTDDQRTYAVAQTLGKGWEGSLKLIKFIRLLALHSAFVFDAATGANRVR